MFNLLCLFCHPRSFGRNCSTTVALAPLRFPIKFGSSISEVFLILIHEIIAVKHRPCLPGADFHDRYFVHPKRRRLRHPVLRRFVNEKPDAVRLGTAAFTLAFYYGSITDTTPGTLWGRARLTPSESNIAAHLVPSLRKSPVGFQLRNTGEECNGGELTRARTPFGVLRRRSWQERLPRSFRTLILFRRPSGSGQEKSSERNPRRLCGPHRHSEDL